MKIFIVSSNLFKGGAEHVGVLLANGFAEKGHSVYLLSDTNLPIAFVLGDKVHVKGVFPLTSNKLVKWMRSVGNIRREVKDIRPDAVIGIAETCSLVSKIACAGLKNPVVYTAHNSFERPETAPMGRWNKIAKFWLGRFYSMVTVLTEADKVFIGKRLKNVSVMPNPLGLQPVNDIPHKRNTILAVGRLDGWHVKGFDVLIRAWARVVSSLEFLVSTDGWKLQIAGTGSEESLNYLKQLCRENGVEDYVDFLGFRKDVEKLYQDASIFVLSSRYEGFGLVLIEAMSQGCACVACDYKGRQREIISPTPALPSREGESSLESHSLGTRNLKLEPQNNKVELCETGILCEPDNVEALADAIAKMITDNDYRESVRKNAIERSKYYSIDRAMDRWETLLKQLK